MKNLFILLIGTLGLFYSCEKTAVSNCNCPDKETVTLRWKEITCQAIGCSHFDAFNAKGETINFSNLDQFALEPKDQTVTMCYNKTPLGCFDPANTYAILCIEGVGRVNHGCEGDGNPCDNAIAGKTVNKTIVGGACGEYYIQDAKGQFYFPLNIDAFPAIKTEGASYQFSFESMPDICNSAPGITITCVKNIANNN